MDVSIPYVYHTGIVVSDDARSAKKRVEFAGVFGTFFKYIHRVLSFLHSTRANNNNNKIVNGTKYRDNAYRTTYRDNAYLILDFSLLAHLSQPDSCQSWL